MLTDILTEIQNMLPIPVRVTVALVAGFVLLTMLTSRLRSDDDPSIRQSVFTGLGGVSVLISGLPATIVVASVIAFVTWPAPRDNILIGGALVGGIVVHAALETAESTGNGLIE